MANVFKTYRVPLQRADLKWLVSDLYAAAFLNALGHEVLGTEDTVTGARSAFVFADHRDFESDYEKFTRGEQIGIRRFLDSVYALKALLKERALQS